VKDQKNIYLCDIAMYRDVWNNFRQALYDLNCEYWANWYEQLFSKGYLLDNEDKAEIDLRLSKVPGEILVHGAAEVAAYLKNAKDQGAVYAQRETRLIILGSAGAGKTTLVRRLNGDASYPMPQDSTHGVDTTITLDCNGTKARIWDFGGQVIYHASHRCFMSANCVYILVVNARTEENRDANRISYWLDTIRIYSENKAKVYIIFNESDNRKQNPEEYDLFNHGDYDTLIQGVFSFNIGEDVSSLEGFKQSLADYVESNGHQAFGKNDRCAMEALKALFDVEKRRVIEASELVGVLKNSGIQLKKDQERAKKLFNTLGIALSYDFMEDCVLDPYWISHGVYKVIEYLQKSKSQFIKYDDLNDVFADEVDTYPEGKRQRILDLMEHHKIGFRNIGGVHGLIVPCATPQFKPKNIDIRVEPDNLMARIERNNLKEFPADLFYRYITVNKDDIRKNENIWAMWQAGMVLAGTRACALVELIENRRIELTVWGEEKEAYRQELLSLIDALLKEYHFETHSEERKDRNGKLMGIIMLVFESIAKGATKAILEVNAGRAVKW